MIKITKKVISIILSMMMVLSGFSALTFSVGAATTDEIPLEELLQDSLVYYDGTPEKVLIGDANLDDEVNIVDAALLQLYSAGLTTFNKRQEIAADTDYDGKIGIKDVSYIQIYSAKLVNYEHHIGEYIEFSEDQDDTTVPVTDPPDTVPGPKPTTEPDPTIESTTEPTTAPVTNSEPTTELIPTTEPVTTPEPTTVPESTIAPTTQPEPTTAPTEPKYIVAGSQSLCGTAWDKSDENNLMTYNASADRYEKVYETIANGTYEYKIAKNGTEFVGVDSSVDNGNIKFTVNTTGTTVTIWYKPDSNEYGQELTEPKFVVAGSQSLCGSAWDKSDENNLMTYNALADRYEKVYELNKGSYEYKIARNGTEFVFTDAGASDGNIRFTITLDKTKVTIWYKPNSNEHGRDIVEPPTTAPTTAPTSQPASTYPTEKTPMLGIDVSQHQGSIDFSKVKAAGIKFVIIRAGYGRSVSQKDTYFESNYIKAKAAGLKVGAYWYSYATSVSDVQLEAEACLSVIKGKQFEFPVYFDLEEQSQFAKGSSFCNSLITNFCSKLENAGYFTGLYMSRSPLTTYISASVREKYALWIAEYGSKCNYNGSYGMWQYSSTGVVNGISGSTDMDWAYVDYSGIIKNKGFNGFPKPGTGGTATKSVDEVAKEVLDGLWGNGDDRIQRLRDAGYDPDVIQHRVNELLEEQKNTTAPTTKAPTTAPTTSPTTQPASTYPTEATPMLGIDVSKHQGSIDFNKVKAAGIKFVIIRAGYGSLISQKDEYFESNYSKAKAAGLKVGVYWYSYASTTAAAITEANVCLQVIKGKQFEFPIFFDLEEQSQFSKGRTFCDTLVNNFCTQVEKAGYFSGLYMSRSPLTSYISASVRDSYALWIAEYNSRCNYSGNYGMWQYSDTGRINGINGYVDMDWAYVDYSGPIRNGGFNNYPKLGSGSTALPSTGKSVDEVAKEVLDGLWGNGAERRQKLTQAGYDPDAVQQRVEELLVERNNGKKSLEEIAQEVLDGLWGNGNDRIQRLKDAGYDPDEVQKKVNELLYGSSSDSSSTPSDTTVTYVVQSGDNLIAIASKYGTTVSAIVEANRSKYPNISASYIQVGWVLTIPTGGASSTRTYTVVSGDNLTAIASKYGTTVNAIIEANKSKYPNISANFIQVGWVLTIP